MRYCIAKSGGPKKWRVYDDYRKEWAEPMDSESDKEAARQRAADKNAAYELAVLNGFVPEKKS